MKIERTFSEEYLSEDNLKTTYTKTVGFDFGEFAIVVLLTIIVYESFRTGFFLTIPIFVWYGLLIVLVIWTGLFVLITVIFLLTWRKEIQSQR